MSFYDKYKEWIDQPLHVLMGASLAFIVAFPLSFITPLWVAVPVGGIVSMVVWRFREYLQHKDHDHEIKWLWSFDLHFIDGGVLIGMIAPIVINYVTW